MEAIPERSDILKHLYRIAVLLVNLCLLTVFIIGPALYLAASPDYYKTQFEKTGIYATVTPEGEEMRTPIYYVGGKSRNVARFTDEQLDAIAAHIIDFLFGDTEDFTLVMDGVELNGEVTDGVSVFGEKAVTHMADVKALMTAARGAVLLALCLLPLLLIFLFMRARQYGRCALRGTLLFYAVLLSAAGGFCLFALRGNPADPASAFWEAAHHLFFPFQPEKVAGSFFNDALTMILSLELFMSAVYTVVAIYAAALIVWLAVAARIRKRALS